LGIQRVSNQWRNSKQILWKNLNHRLIRFS
jgi:hypothetical protein